MRMPETIEAAISSPEGEVRRLLRADRSHGFGLLEHDSGGWTLCIPAGAEACCEGEPVDLRALRLDPSGERRMPYAFGRTAEILMDGFRFEVRAASRVSA